MFNEEEIAEANGQVPIVDSVVRGAFTVKACWIVEHGNKTGIEVRL